MTSKPGTMSPDSKTDEAVKETFPASDPVATTGTRGNRAVAPGEMMQDAPPIPDAVTLRRHFPDAEAAKLALESLVRDGPVDPRHAEIASGSPSELRLKVAANDEGRIRKLLDTA
ncbi:hypothetical protein [Falsiroseomonas sp. CW058]|uniref:hypothetical protein n=1 Tax=Falsiroseomonas sp. CW058 TaxID=3388664 RepID=UPI003D311D51